MSYSSEPDLANLLNRLAIEEEPDLWPILELARQHEALCQTLLNNLSANEDRLRINSYRVLDLLSTILPDVLYPIWSDLVARLSSSNAFQRGTAVKLIAKILPADREKRFDSLVEQYMGLLDDSKLMVARYLAQSIPRVLEVRPDLAAAVVRRLLAVDRTHPLHGRKELLKADIIRAFAEIYPKAPGQEQIIAFVRGSSGSASPSTRQAAKDFLARFAA